jgi:MFS transporter, ACS family, glucarate transporter
VSLLLLVSSAGYICRVALTVVGPGIMADFHLTQAQLGAVFSAFLIGYTLCQVPSGWLADHMSSRRLFLILAVSWTFLALATAAVGPAVGGFAALLAVRFLFGVMAAPTYPASARVIGVNLAPQMQGTANGFVLASIGIGSAITPLLLGGVMRNYGWGWRSALLLPAAITAVAVVMWACWSPRNLRIDPQVAVRGKATVLRSARFWFLVGSYTLQGYVGYIFIFWFYLYLVQVRHFEVMRAAGVTALPWVCALFAIPLGGLASDAAVRYLGATWGRRLLPLSALVIASALLVVGARTGSASCAVACLTLCIVLVIGTEGAFWATLNQITERQGGMGGGIMNFGSNLGGMMSPMVTPWLAERIGWSAALSATAALATVSGLLWLGVTVGPKEGWSNDAKPSH